MAIIDKVIMMLTLAVLTNMIFTWESVEAKRGCANFGHSCYGGIGKRAETNEETMQNNIQDTEHLAYVFSGPRSQLTSTNIARPFRYNKFLPEEYEQMNNYIRDWILNYLRKEEENEQK